MDNYGASPQFNNLWQWKERDATHGDILNVKDTEEPAYIMAVATISADKLYVKSQGNYTQSFQMKLGSAKMQLTLKRPEDTIYAADFDTLLANLEKVQDAVKTSTYPQQYLIIQDDKGNKCIRLSYSLFEPKVILSWNLCGYTYESDANLNCC